MDTVVLQAPGPSREQVHRSQLQWLSSQSKGAPLSQGLVAAVCLDKLEAVGIARVGWPLASARWEGQRKAQCLLPQTNS